MSIVFKKKLKFIKNNFNVSSIDIAKDIGIKIEKFRSYEFGNSMPSYEVIKKLSSVFSLSIDYLLTENNFFINFTDLFKLASETNYISNADRNHIDDSITHFIKKMLLKKDISKFDDTDKYKFTSSFNLNFKILRETNKLTLDNIAKLLGYSAKGSVWKFEKKSFPPPEVLYLISQKFDISIHYLLTGIPLYFSIEDNILLKHLFIFDKTAPFEAIQSIKILIKQILHNNKITS